MSFRKFVFFIGLHHQRALKQYFYISRICSGSQVKNQNTSANLHSKFRRSRCPRTTRNPKYPRINKTTHTQAEMVVNVFRIIDKHIPTVLKPEPCFFSPFIIFSILVDPPPARPPRSPRSSKFWMKICSCVLIFNLRSRADTGNIKIPFWSSWMIKTDEKYNFSEIYVPML